MNMKRISAIYLILSVLLSCGSDLLAQNARFSQPFTAPLMLNPALSGNFAGTYRIGLQTSWQKTINSNMAHQYFYFDAHLKENERGNYFGIGATAYNYGDDYLGFVPTSGPITAQFASLSGAYHINLDDEAMGQWLSFGAQVAGAQGMYDNKRGVYDKEIGGGGFKYVNIDNAQKVAFNKYLDFNLGLTYSYAAETVSAEFGASVYHLFGPKSSLKGEPDEYRQKARFTVHANIAMELGEMMLVMRNIFWQEGLYYNNTSLDSQKIFNNTTGFEIQNRRKEGRFYVDAGFYTRNLRTLMPYVSMHFGPAVNMRTSYELPMPSYLGPVRYYTAKRFEVGINVTFGALKSNGDLFSSKGGPHRGIDANFW